MSLALAKASKLDNAFENVLATGNLPSMADLGMQQESGITDLVDWKAMQYYRPLISIY